MAAIDDLIAVLEQRLRQAKQAKRLYGHDPAFAVHVALIPFALHPPYPNRDKTAWQKIEEYFRSRGNRWAWMGEVCGGTGLRRNVVCQVFSRTHSHLVECQRTHGFAKTRWRLRTEEGISENDS
jgi:hypothetical protein